MSDQIIFSANDHLIEPPHLYDGRVPARFARDVPRVVPDGDGGQQWVYGSTVRPLYRSCAVAGMTPEEWLGSRTVTIDQIRPGCYDPDKRLVDMDTDGVRASACYSSPAGIGFGGDFFHAGPDPELDLACIRAWNDWYHEEWVGRAPDRFVPIGVTSYDDPVAGAAEIVRNAERGFRGVTFRNPTDLGLPSLADAHWDPILRACAETETVLCHHTNENMSWPNDPKSPYGLRSTLFQSSAMEVVASWLWAGITVRFPRLRVTVAESGGSWLPHLVERLQWSVHYSSLHRRGWPDPDRDPLELLRDTFVFSTLEIPTALRLEEELGLTGWMLESDYPHMESLWPNTSSVYAEQLDGLDAHHAEALAWRNAAELFRFPILTPPQPLARSGDSR